MSVLKKKRVIETGYGNAILSNNVKNHSNDPFVVKKVEEAKAFLQKVGLPDLKKTML